VQVEVPKPRILVSPGGERVDILEWLYSTQFDLDSCGNTFGLITETDGSGLPARVDLVPYTDVTVQVRQGVVSYRIAGVEYAAADVWHERQFTTSGVPVGLSPIAHASMTINASLSAQQFAMQWFDAGAAPIGHLKNTAKILKPGDADIAKSRFKASTANRDLFVTGSDWDYEMISAKASEAQFIEQQKMSTSDIGRFLGVPGDLIDAENGSASITYANITQRHLQLLVINLGPALIRREAALSRMLPQPRYVKLNSDALLRMDPAQRSTMLSEQVTSRRLAPSEARELDNRAPFTPEQIAEFATLFPSKAPTPQNGATT
jgi:HK97 family phage portal protein